MTDIFPRLDDRDTNNTQTVGQTYDETTSRWPFLNQEKRPQKTPNLLTL